MFLRILTIFSILFFSNIFGALISSATHHATKETELKEDAKNLGSNLRISKPKHLMRLPDTPIYNEAGEKIYFEKFEGKPVLLSFWATWCAPCVAEMPDLDRLKRDFRKLPIEILAISEDFQGVDVIKNFYKENGIRSLDIYKDDKNALFKDLSITGLPTSFFVDKEGVVKLIIEGSINWNNEQMRQKLLDHIEESGLVVPGESGLELPKNTSSDISLDKHVKPEIKEKGAKEQATKDESVKDVVGKDESTKGEAAKALDVKAQGDKTQGDKTQGNKTQDTSNSEGGAGLQDGAKAERQDNGNPKSTVKTTQKTTQKTNPQNTTQTK